MRSGRLNAPPVARLTLKFFGAYARWYMRGNLHALRVTTLQPPKLEGVPLIVCMNHPSWWDPLVAMTVALRLFPERRHYAPIEANALTNYGFFERIGYFGVQPGTAAGAAKFLRVGSAILSNAKAMLWVTSQGRFSDVRKRPVELQSGLGHLAQRCGPAAVLPIAIEYPYWEERFPEALVRFGEPILIQGGSSIPAAEWTQKFASALEATQDRLAADAIARNAAAFEVLVGGNFGVGGIYDLWRWSKAKVRGQVFHRAHGTGHL